MTTKLPHTVTWVVARMPNGVVRAICLEATHPSRLRTFERRYGDWTRHVTQDWGLDWQGKKLTKDERKRLRNSIYRLANAQDRSSSASAVLLHQVGLVITAAAQLHGVARDDIIAPAIRAKAVARARGYAAHLMKRQLQMPLAQIARALGWSNHSCVQYWLEKPFEALSQPYTTKDPP